MDKVTEAATHRRLRPTDGSETYLDHMSLDIDLRFDGRVGPIFAKRIAVEIPGSFVMVIR